MDLLLHQTPRAAYVHVPFCVHRCGYCDFTVIAQREDLIAQYLQAMALQLQTLGEPQPVQTLFLGGGTPTHLSEGDLETLLNLVRHWFPLLPQGEFSVEANPAGFTREKIHLLVESGVNRVSLGAQSFDPLVLKFLERDHDPETIQSVVEQLAKVIPNFSLDFIFGVPGQSLSSWNATLDQALKLHPAHVSTYGLTFEKGTAFWNRLHKGEIAQAPAELERAMYAIAMDRLNEAGFPQYELSNFARLGFRCRHNETYWQGLPFFGFGPGAASYQHGKRAMNHRSVSTWLKKVFAKESPVMDVEELSPEDQARELCVLALRTTAGIDKIPVEQRTGFSAETLAKDAIARHLSWGLLEETETHLRLTREGRFLADSVVADFL